MKIDRILLHPYEIAFTTGLRRLGVWIQIMDWEGRSGWGDVAPLPKWSRETLECSIRQFHEKKGEIRYIDWVLQNCFVELAKLQLLPALSFGLESALLSLLDPLAEGVPLLRSALFMGTPVEILEQAKLREEEGYTSAKLKVSNLLPEEAKQLIMQLKDRFHLRIDVNRAWTTRDSLQFFSQFPLDTFDYVEEPFQDPLDLAQFSHPLAVDESFPKDFSLADLEKLPTFKALIYKPTIQGGILEALPLHEWATRRGIALVASSSFESDLGLASVASMAHRLSLTSPVGIGTSHFIMYTSPAPF